MPRAAAGRDPWSVTLVAVTKTFPAADIAILLGPGRASTSARAATRRLARSWRSCRRASRAMPQAERPAARAAGALRRPAADEQVPIGRALRRLRAHRRPGRGRDRAGRRDRRAPAGLPLPVFVQVSLDGDPARGGAVARASCAELADQVAADERLRLLGVMAVAPLTPAARGRVRDVAEISAAVRAPPPRRGQHLGRHERRLRDGHQTRRDTRPNRFGVARPSGGHFRLASPA